MIQTCLNCATTYDDCLRSTICPHNQFISDANARRKDLAFSFSGQTIRFKDRFLKVDSPLRQREFHLQSIDWGGYIILAEIEGSYDPEVFEVVPA